MILNKIKNKLENFFIAFLYGVKATGDDIFGQKTTSGSDGGQIVQQMRRNELGEALLKGEVTEEVEKLRDRTYLISDESKNFNVVIDTVGTTKAFKKKLAKMPTPKVFNHDGYVVKIVMDNDPIPSSVLDGLNSVGGYGIKNDYPLKFEYEYTPKFKLNEYVKKMVISHNAENNTTLMDLYIPKYVDSFERLEKIFDNEIIKIKNNKTRPFNIEFNKLSFVSNKTYGVDDFIPYEFKTKKFIGINEYDGKWVLTYETELLNENEKLTNKYINKELRKSYANNESRNTKFNLGMEVKSENYCEKCGKLITNDYDFRITKETTGYGICNECLNDFIKKNNE